MRKVISFMHASLDGFVQGKDPWDLGWISYNEELERFASETLSSVTTVVFGRVTFLGMDAHWRAVPSDPGSTEYELRHADWLERAEKLVLSTTLEGSDWNNTRVVRGDVPAEVARLKAEPGGDIVLMGSPGAAQTFIRHDLIDEYRLTVSPVVLGAGRRLFEDVPDRRPLRLADARTFKSGALALIYARDAARPDAG
jgi:dihydrofolate reductase